MKKTWHQVFLVELHKIDGMIVTPCSMKTLSAIANGYDDTLVARAAGVTN